MIFFPAPGGRLGNLLFQWAHIHQIRKKNEIVIATQLKGLENIIGPFNRVFYTDQRWVIRALDYIIMPFIIRPLISLGIFGKVEEINGQVTSRNGLLPIRVVTGYFQYGSAGNLKLKENLRNGQLSKLGDYQVNLFVHVRRGDYVDHQFGQGVNPLLPKSYYSAALSILLKKYPDAKIFFVGDSPDWCEVNFQHVKGAKILRQPPVADLALMSLCNGGVVSNSTFAWWGAKLCKQTAPIIGPRHWMGWRIKTWFPENIETPWIEYLDVEGECD